MSTYISIGDFIDILYKVRVRGFQYFRSKFKTGSSSRVKATWDANTNESSNWWQILAIKDRWNESITGEKGVEYEEFVYQNYLKDLKDCRVLSIGCGVGSHIRKIAAYPNIAQAEGLDLSAKRIEDANRLAGEAGLNNTVFTSTDIFDNRPGHGMYDLILFHSSLHHFSQLDELIGQIVLNALKPEGILVIHEFVGPNRLQWTRDQLRFTNHLLKMLPRDFRRKAVTRSVKRKAYRPGIWRMLLSDPSEAVRSQDQLPTIGKYFDTVYFRSLGGNILHLLLKDIALNFHPDHPESIKILNRMIQKEDEFLKQEGIQPDFIFGIYWKKRKSQ